MLDHVTSCLVMWHHTRSCDVILGHVTSFPASIQRFVMIRAWIDLEPWIIWGDGVNGRGVQSQLWNGGRWLEMVEGVYNGKGQYKAQVRFPAKNSVKLKKIEMLNIAQNHSSSCRLPIVKYKSILGVSLVSSFFMQMRPKETFFLQFYHRWL